MTSFLTLDAAWITNERTGFAVPYGGVIQNYSAVPVGSEPIVGCAGLSTIFFRYTIHNIPALATSANFFSWGLKITWFNRVGEPFTCSGPPLPGHLPAACSFTGVGSAIFGPSPLQDRTFTRAWSGPRWGVLSPAYIQSMTASIKGNANDGAIYGPVTHDFLFYSVNTVCNVPTYPIEPSPPIPPPPDDPTLLPLMGICCTTASLPPPPPPPTGNFRDAALLFKLREPSIPVAPGAERTHIAWIGVH